MLITYFSVGVDIDQADAMQEKIEGFGIEMQKRALYNEKGFSNEMVSRIYFDCFAPIARLRMLVDYLENEYEGTAVLSY